MTVRIIIIIYTIYKLIILMKCCSRKLIIMSFIYFLYKLHSFDKKIFVYKSSFPILFIYSYPFLYPQCLNIWSSLSSKLYKISKISLSHPTCLNIHNSYHIPIVKYSNTFWHLNIILFCISLNMQIYTWFILNLF